MADSDDDLFGAEHVRVYRQTDGQRGFHWRGTTILLLTTTGRRSGQPHTTAEGSERERLWSLMAEVWPAYNDYQAKTERQIPVVVLTRR